MLIAQWINLYQSSEMFFSLSQKSLDLDTVELLSNYISLLLRENKTSNTTCKVIGKSIEVAILLLEQTNSKLQYYEEEKVFPTTEYTALKREYIHALFRLYILTELYSDICGEKIVNILYFYSTPCDSCPLQGEIIKKVQKSYEKNVFVYSFDADLEDVEPLISTLRYEYTITSFPTTIVNGKKFEGLTGEEELKEYIDSIFKSK